MVSLLLLVAILLNIFGTSHSVPVNQYVYSVDRDYLLQKETEYAANRLELNNEEKIVNQYLSHLKWEEFNRTEAALAPSRPIEEVMAGVQQTALYQALRKLPKGGNMHIHESHVVSKRKLMDILFESEDFPHLYIRNDTAGRWILDFFINPPNRTGEDWVNVKNNTEYFSRERIAKEHTLIGTLTEEAKKYPTDSRIRWTLMGPQWGRSAARVINNVKIRPKYMQEMLQSALDEGVQYMESRKSLYGSLYRLDAHSNYSSVNGRVPLDTEGEVELNLTMKTVQEFVANNSNFIGFKTIVYSSRSRSKALIQRDIDRVIRFHRKYPKWIVGYDLVGEEDAGHSHLFFMENLLTLYNQTTKKDEVDLYMHTAETNFADDQVTGRKPKNPTSALQNAYDSIVLGVNRVGHGIGYIKHPYLMEILRERQIAVETCPVSNQVLGMMADLRNHPAQTYIRSGIPVVMGSDDPGTFGYDNFTLDWYMAYLGWGLDLADLKLLAQNSLNYSAMSGEEKTSAMSKFESYWNRYIKEKKDEACGKQFTGIPQFAKMLPTEGAKMHRTKVYIFGTQFDRAICKDIKCKFGDKESSHAELVSTQLIVCESPPSGSNDETTVPVMVVLDGKEYDTTYHFTYKYDRYTPPSGVTTPTAAPTTGTAARSMKSLLCLLAAMVFINCCYSCLLSL